MASGHVNRANRPNTWLRRPATTVVAQMRPAYGRYRGDLGPDMVRYVDHGVFPLSNDGVAEVTLVCGHSVVATHTPETTVDSLLQRHVGDSEGMVLVVRHRRDGSRLHLATNGSVSAYSDDGLTWHEGDATPDAREALRRFIAE